MNKEKIMGVMEKVKSALKKVSKKIWIIIAAAVLVLAVGIVVFFSNRPYAPLIVGANADEAGAVVTWLTDQGISDYRLEGTGTILVPEGQAANLKARLLMAQYSKSGSSYSGYFERVGALSTQSDRENAWLITLIDVMEDTIRHFEGVQDASLTISLGEDRRYILDDSNITKASAALMVTMEGNQLLTAEQAAAIRNYIAHSVADLDISDVSIIDSWGNNYDLVNTIGNAADASALKLQLEQQHAQLIRQRIMQVLLPFYGEDNLDVSVSVVIDLDEKTIDDYAPRLPEEGVWTESGGAGIIGSRVGSYTVLTNDQIAAGGLVGTGSNAQIPTDVEQDPTQDDYDGKLQGSYEIEYMNPATQTHTVRVAGYITDCTVAVSINSDAVQGTVDTDRIAQHAARAAGINAVQSDTMTAQEYLNSKISVLAQPFYALDVPVGPDGPDAPSFLDTYLWVIVAAGVGLLLFAIVLTVILLIRKKRRKKQEEEQRAVEELLAVAMPEEVSDEPVLDEDGNPVSGADVMDLHTERSMELRQSIRDFVDENMEVAALLIRGWLKGEDDNG